MNRETFEAINRDLYASFAADCYAGELRDPAVDGLVHRVIEHVTDTLTLDQAEFLHNKAILEENLRGTGMSSFDLGATF